MRHHLYIIMEYCKYTLENYIKQFDPQANLRLSLMYQSATGIEYLHQKNIAHRDIKPNNIMIKGDSQQPLVKVMDFTFARDLTDKETGSMNTVRGNCHWMAPELLDDYGIYIKCRYHMDVDIYSLGLVFAYTCMNQRGQVLITGNVCMYIQYLLRE